MMAQAIRFGSDPRALHQQAHLSNGSLEVVVEPTDVEVCLGQRNYTSKLKSILPTILIVDDC